MSVGGSAAATPGVALDAQALGELLERRVRPWVASRVPASDVDDVMQEVWLRMHRALHQLRGSLVGWVQGVARSAVGDHLRARLRHPLVRVEAPEPEAPADEATEGDDGAAAAQLSAALVGFIASLPAPYREALTLTDLEGLTQAEAARMLGVSLPAMKSRVLRGRERLRVMLDQCCEIALDARRRVIACRRREDDEARSSCCPR